MSIKRVIVFTLFAFYVISAAFMLFLMRESLWGVCSYGEYFRENTNFVPFRTVAEFADYLRSNDDIYGDISAENIFGNIIAFLPIGVFFPAIWKKQRRFGSFALTAAAVIISVEIIQFITMRGACDIDDFILNFFGAVIGFSLSRLTIVKKLAYVGEE